VKTGRLVMEELAKLMNGKGKIGILAGNQNAPNLQNRVKGVKEEAAKSPGIQILGTFKSHRDAAGRSRRSHARHLRVSRHQGWAMIGRVGAVHAGAAHRSRPEARERSRPSTR
jgi:ribose transport system substrate-binding protein